MKGFILFAMIFETILMSQQISDMGLQDFNKLRSLPFGNSVIIAFLWLLIKKVPFIRFFIICKMPVFITFQYKSIEYSIKPY